MLIKAYRIGKVALFPLLFMELVVELSLNAIVWYGTLMAGLFTFLSFPMCCDDLLERNMCKMIQCEDYHEFEVLCLVSNTSIILKVY